MGAHRASDGWTNRSAVHGTVEATLGSERDARRVERGGGRRVARFVQSARTEVVVDLSKRSGKNGATVSRAVVSDRWIDDERAHGRGVEERTREWKVFRSRGIGRDAADGVVVADARRAGVSTNPRRSERAHVCAVGGTRGCAPSTRADSNARARVDGDGSDVAVERRVLGDADGA